MPSSGPQQLEPLEAGGPLDGSGPPRKRSSNRACWSGGTVIALIFTTLMRLPFPGRARSIPRWGTLGAVSTHRTADLGFARLDLDRARAPARPRSSTPPGRRPSRPSPASRRCCDGGVGARLGHPGGRRHRRGRAGALARRVVDAEARCVFVGELPDAGRLRCWCSPPARPTAPVAAEVAATLAASGVGCRRVDDVGVAGVHRVLAVAPDIAAADVVVVVAGMDGALPSVVAGLTDRLVVAVPTSVGYGAAFEGLAALLTMLTACAPGRPRGQHRQRVRRRRGRGADRAVRLSGSGRDRAAVRSSSRTGSPADRPPPARTR